MAFKFNLVIKSSTLIHQIVSLNKTDILKNNLIEESVNSPLGLSFQARCTFRMPVI